MSEMRSVFMDSFECKAKEKELEPKYMSVPNILFNWMPPSVLQAINTLLLHNPAGMIHSTQGRWAGPHRTLRNVQSTLQ